MTDYTDMTAEQLAARYKELPGIQTEQKRLSSYYNALQMALKLVLNGSYGAFANAFFVCSNKDIAGAITAMGRELIQYMDTCNEEYWYDLWHLDAELHERLGVAFVSAIDPMYRHRKTDELVEKPTKDELKPDQDGDGPLCQRVAPVSIYADTDSLFVGFDAAMKSCDWQGDPMAFIDTINKHRLEDYFKKRLAEYAGRYGVDNIQDFELERINRNAIFLKKKLYVQHVAWEERVSFKPLEYLFPKGIKLVQSSTPPFAREKVREIIEYLFLNPDTYSIKDLLKLVRDIKKQFELADIEDISVTTSTNSYKKNILADTGTFAYEKGSGVGVKAAAFYNHLLYTHPQYKEKYDVIKPGTKIKYYACKHALNEAFGYMRGSYPREFAPEVDIDVQFEKTVLNQVNTFVKAMNMPELNKRLRVVLPLF